MIAIANIFIMAALGAYLGRHGNVGGLICTIITYITGFVLGEYR